MSVVFRPDIQGLRAIAVIGVVLFHIWPSALAGGYAGVDVFFVISGFLIAGLLLREAEATGRVSVLQFYVRRVRRLIPAATLVLAAVALMSLVLLPSTRHLDTALEIVASALYVENWRLASTAVDYLASENAASPVRHYWSLSIEEQFYVAWPLLLVLVAALAARTGRSVRHMALVALGVVTLASFVASVVITAAQPAQAYFVTQTRIWELGVGGLLAFVRLPVPGPRLAEGMRAAGLAAIAASFVLFSSETSFPGYAALLPVLGATAVIAAGPTGGNSVLTRMLSRRPMQFLGDASYSIYLWHWPLIVFAAANGYRSPSVIQGLVLIGATLVAAALTKRFVEDRFRRPGSLPPKRVATLGLASVAVSLVAALVLHVPTAWSPARKAGPISVADYPGPAAFLEGARVPEVSEYFPSDVPPKDDVAKVYDEKCHLGFEDTNLRPCTFGSTDAATHILVAGDSHAASWTPAFEELARVMDWQVESNTKSSCPLLVEPVQRAGTAYDECLKWGRLLLDRIKAERPDLVIMTMSTQAQLARGNGVLVEAVVKTWRAIVETGTRLVVIADTPRHKQIPLECIQVDPACATPTKEALRADAQVEASRLLPQVGLIDMNDAFCRAGLCPMVIGNVVAWRDVHHFTATYARMLAPVLGARLAPFVK